MHVSWVMDDTIGGAIGGAIRFFTCGAIGGAIVDTGLVMRSNGTLFKMVGVCKTVGGGRKLHG